MKLNKIFFWNGPPGSHMRWPVKSVSRTRTRTGNLLLLISPLILRCFAKTFSFIVYFIYLKHIDYNKMLKVKRCSFLISRSVKCVTRITKVDNSVLPEPEIVSFITRFLLENRVFFHLKPRIYII